ncbi:hypothetical protein Bhyg_03311 [Pseudolycoriella hygida]|uniref:Uncharacterized protein n=1 Tax=Pseudolycoriella hygida TaxID=35572 RepID=A0A9Q0ND34_9DIPT|nr:hypothetical protein Bhyg_03311 [Pseudolycoriella hygida]
MSQLSLKKLDSVVGLEEIIISTEVICKHAQKIRNAYEHLIVRYEVLSKENAELRNGSTNADFCAPFNHKRRKTEELNDSERSNDVLNEAIQELSSCGNIEDEIIESTPKPDVTKRNVSKKITTSKTPVKRSEIKLEKIDDSKCGDIDEQKVKLVHPLESPLKSVENQCNVVDKENRPKNISKWIMNSFETPNRVIRTGLIITKSPKAFSRLSLSKQTKQSTSETKPAEETANDTCCETFLDGTLHKQVSNTKKKFLRQPCLEAFLNSSREGSDDENVFNFKSNLKSSKSPLKIKLEPLTGQAKESKSTNVSPTNSRTSTTGNDVLQAESGGSSVVAFSGEPNEVIVIQESQPLFEDFSETFCDKVEMNIQAVESLSKEQKISENERIIKNHLILCRQCELFMSSNPHLSICAKLNMVDKCKYSVRPDTDPEFWNPRFLPTPESQKQETLIDDRWTTRKRKP